MANDKKLEKRMEFIVEQQAQFAVDIQLLKERLDDFQSKSDERMTRIENILVRSYEDTSTKLDALIDSQMRTDQRLSEMNDRLNIFMDGVERLVNARTNGTKKEPKPASGKPRRPGKRKN